MNSRKLNVLKSLLVLRISILSLLFCFACFENLFWKFIEREHLFAVEEDRHLGLYLKLTNSKSQVKSIKEAHAKEMSLSLCGETTLLLYATSHKRASYIIWR